MFLLPKTRCVLRLLRIPSTKSYCQGKKDPPKAPGVVPPDEKVVIAPKVVAKDPPIEELTRGRRFDPVTQSYKTIKPEDDDNKKQTKSAPATFEAMPSPEPTALDATIRAEINKAAEEEVLKERRLKAVMRKQLTLAFMKKAPSESSVKDAEGTQPVLPSGDGPAKTPPGHLSPTTPTSPAPPSGGSTTPVERIQRTEPPRVMFCLFPYNWVKDFNNKTGITGFWTFLFTYGTYLISKEKLVMEHEYYSGLSVVLLSWLCVKYVGPSFAQSLDDQIDAYENSFKQLRIDEKQMYENHIKHEENLQLSMEEQLNLVLAKRENVDWQLEAEYRSRQMRVYKRVKDMLDFHVVHDQIERKYAQDNMVDWVVQKVNESITDEIDSKYVDQCLNELENLAKVKKAI